MNASRLTFAAAAVAAAFAGAPALADTATFTTVPVTGCANCTATDATGLAVNAIGHLLPNGWDVKTGASGLYIANGAGGVFTLPAQTFPSPGKTFDLTGLKLFAINRTTSTTAPVNYTLYAFHPGNPIADVVQLTINSRVVRDLALSDPRLLNIDTLVVRYGPEILYSYFIQVRFTPH